MSNMTQQEALHHVANIFDQLVPFDHLLGLDIQHYDIQRVEIVINMKPALIGNTHQQILHRGVSATILDVAGGLNAFSSSVAGLSDQPATLGSEHATKTHQKPKYD